MSLGLSKNTVRLVPYRPEWAALYEQEKARVMEAIGTHVLDVQHVGSTAIPGIVAKPVLDIAIAVAEFEAATVCIAPLQALGYRYRGENGIPRRHYFVRGEPRSHQIHMLETDGSEWERMIRFRDYLRAHPETAAEYAALKQRLAALHPTEVQRYADAKRPFVERILALARRESAE